GHIFGDRVLTELAASLKTMTRSGDIVGRVDGDQFLFCLSNTRDDARYLEKRAAFLCQGLRRQFGNGLEITVSMGIALYPRDGSSFQELFEKSAMALYYAKRSGNSRYIFSTMG
ncbi:MAG TPA: GGDEF domain-containing protein, partial [Candidatus Limiplasma sp.]|nr:GGDEF domain-containing protein [Candidatus Limiplasma sp.]